MAKFKFDTDPGFRKSTQYSNHYIDRWGQRLIDHGTGSYTYRGKDGRF